MAVCQQTEPPSPPPKPNNTTSSLPPKSTWVLTERVGERALLLSDLFILQQVIHPLSAVTSTLCAMSPRPVPLSPPWKPSCQVRDSENKLCTWINRQTHDSLDGRILVFSFVFWLQVFLVHMRQLQELSTAVKRHSTHVPKTPCLHPLLDTDEDLASQEELNLPDS